jgi:hypothetical protein
MYHPAIQRQLIEAHQRDLRQLITSQQPHLRSANCPTRRDRPRRMIRLRPIARSA